MNSIRRNRPAIGTFLDISLEGSMSVDALKHVIGKAFAEAERLERLLSRFIPQSDVSHINTAPLFSGVSISPETAEILRWSQKFECETDGSFSVDVLGGGLVGGLSWNGPEEVACERSVSIDLGGIGKGFIVDKLVQLLLAEECSGVVNAGGDLAVFGDAERTVHVRSPLPPYAPCESVVIRNGALASSGDYFTKIGRGESRLYQGRSRSFLAIPHRSVFVSAAECFIADAFTKIIRLVSGEPLRVLLEEYHVVARVLTPFDGGVCRA